MECGLVNVQNVAAVPNVYQALSLLSLTEKFCLEVDHRHTYQFIKNSFTLKFVCQRNCRRSEVVLTEVTQKWTTEVCDH